MEYIFSAIEVIDIGIEKEKNRRDFYKSVSQKFDDKALKELFINLFEWETGHVAKFTEIRKNVAGSPGSATFKDDAALYIKSLIGDRLYKELTSDGFDRIVKTPLVAIYYSITFEKDSILLFSELTKYLHPLDKEKVRILIEEEKKHIIYLTELKSKYEI